MLYFSMAAAINTVNKKKNLILDAELLALNAEKNKHRTGIFWCNYNLFKEFAAQNRFNIFLYCSPLKFHTLLKEISSFFSFLDNCPIINMPEKIVCSRYLNLSSPVFVSDYSADKYGVFSGEKAQIRLYIDDKKINSCKLIIDFSQIPPSVSLCKISDGLGKEYIKLQPPFNNFTAEIILEKNQINNKLLDLFIETEHLPGEISTPGVKIASVRVIINGCRPCIDFAALESFKRKKYLKRLNTNNLFKKIYLNIGINFLKLFIFVFKKYSDGSSCPILKNADYYFSAANNPPPEIAAMPNIISACIIHDIAPLHNPALIKQWPYGVIAEMTENSLYFAVSDFTRNEVIKYTGKSFSDNLFTMPLSSNLPYKSNLPETEINRVREKYNIPAGKKYILTLGNISVRKQQAFAVKNYFEFLERNNIENLVYVLAGDCESPEKESLEQVLKSRPLYKHNIIQTGYADDGDLNALYCGAFMLVHVSSYEGFGLPLLEAMKCAVPVIASNNTAIPEVLGDCGILINTSDGAQLQKALEKMYYDASFRQECIKKGLARAQLFSWQKAVSLISDKMLAFKKTEL